MSYKTGRRQFQLFHLLLRWLTFAFLLWETFHVKPYFLKDPLQPLIGVQIVVFYTLVCSGILLTSKLPFNELILVLLDLLTGMVLFFLYHGELHFILPFFMATYAASTFSWKLSIGTTLIGAVVFVAGKFYHQGIAEQVFDHPDWLLFLVLGLSLSTLGLFRFETLREREKAESLVTLIEAGQFGSALTYDSLFKLVLEIVKNLFGASTYAVYLKSEEGVLKLQGVEGPDAKSFSDFDPAQGKTALLEVINRRSPLIFEDIQRLPEGQEKVIPRSSHIRAGMAVPLALEAETSGLLFLASSTPKAFDLENLRLFMIIANQAAVSYKNIRLQEKAEALAVRDSVSGLYTYAHMQEILDREFRRCKYANLPLTAIIIDIDQFKKINEGYGHAQGDSALHQLGAVLKTVTRATDFICRYGGDEFMLILPETNRIGAMLVGERVRQTIADYEFILGSNIVKITVSGGVATYPEEIETKKELIEKAEAALTEAKKRGENNICFETESPTGQGEQNVSAG